jgi:MFS transporter, DHA1 family, inner membrane transport protein
VIGLRALTGVVAPVVPLAAEHVGRRLLMVGGVLATMVGCLLVTGAPGLAVAAVGLVLSGLAKPFFDVPMQGWFGARVAYRRRGRVLGLTELTWALGLAITVPAGALIALTSWRAPFVLVAVLAAAGAAAVTALIPADRPPARVRRPLRLRAVHLRLLAVIVLFRVAAETLFLSYGRWLEADFGLSVAAIGAFTLVVVLAELGGEGSVAAFSDRLGLRRTVLLGLAGSAVAYLALSAVGGSLALAIVVVVAWFVSFEITIVATIPLASELAPEARDRLLALVAMSSAVAAAVAAPLAPQLFAWRGIAGAGWVAAGLVAGAALLLLRVQPASVPGTR